MENQFKESVPIYLQLMDQIRYAIVSGKRKPGERIESVRDLAMAWGVNPNTVQRALSELEREGLLYSERTSGRYVTEDGERIHNLRGKLAAELAETFFRDMEQIGYTREETVELLRKKEETADGGDVIWTA